jgi:hypothetical protein
MAPSFVGWLFDFWEGDVTFFSVGERVVTFFSTKKFPTFPKF